MQISPQNSSLTQIRLRLYIPLFYRRQPIVSRLILEYGLIVNITGARLETNSKKPGQFDLELSGTLQQIRSGLAYLETLNLKIVGKPNTAGDGWYC